MFRATVSSIVEPIRQRDGVRGRPERPVRALSGASRPNSVRLLVPVVSEADFGCRAGAAAALARARIVEPEPANRAKSPLSSPHYHGG